MNGVKASVWVSVISVILFSLAQRMNYTLDVVLGTYFSITTWAMYHRLANDVITGHSFSSVWLIDKMVIYPIMEWMEACADREGLSRYKNTGSPRRSAYQASAIGESSFGESGIPKPPVRLYRRDSDLINGSSSKNTFRTSEI